MEFDGQSSILRYAITDTVHFVDIREIAYEKGEIGGSAMWLFVSNWKNVCGKFIPLKAGISTTNLRDLLDKRLLLKKTGLQ